VLIERLKVTQSQRFSRLSGHKELVASKGDAVFF
jgi:hypothetical protein